MFKKKLLSVVSTLKTPPSPAITPLPSDVNNPLPSQIPLVITPPPIHSLLFSPPPPPPTPTSQSPIPHNLPSIPEDFQTPTKYCFNKQVGRYINKRLDNKSAMEEKEGAINCDLKDTLTAASNKTPPIADNVLTHSSSPSADLNSDNNADGVESDVKSVASPVTNTAQLLQHKMVVNNNSQTPPGLGHYNFICQTNDSVSTGWQWQSPESNQSPVLSSQFPENVVEVSDISIPYDVKLDGIQQVLYL